MMGFQRLSCHAMNVASKTTIRNNPFLKYTTSSPLSNTITPFTRLLSTGTTDTPPSTTEPNKNHMATYADSFPEAGYNLNDYRFENNKPTLAYAKVIPSDYSSMRHEQIIQLCVEGDYGARQEALIRNVMSVDEVEYDQAVAKVEEINKYNESSLRIHSLPYHVGLGTAITGGIISFPMIFQKETVMAFNDKFVTTDVPVPEDLETYLEVSMWSWNWMEPICGQVSFVLLVLQFARSQMMNIGLRPYGDMMKNVRSNALVKKYPQYNEIFVRWYSDGNTVYGTN